MSEPEHVDPSKLRPGPIRDEAWLAYHEDYLGNETLPIEEERKLLGALIAISTGIEDVSKLKVPVEFGRRLVQCYDDPAGN